MQVMYKLFQGSWRDDAVKLDREKGVYTDPALVRKTDHEGKYFKVEGPHICQPSPQRTPLLLQAGASKSGRRFAAQHAEAVFVSAHAPEVCKDNIAAIRHLAVTDFGRPQDAIKVLALVTPILATTPEEAERKHAEYRSYVSTEGALALFGGWTGIDMSVYGEDEELRAVETNAVRSTVEGYAKYSPHDGKWTKRTLAEHIGIGGNGPVLVGTPQRVADLLEQWVEIADVDGFNLAYAVFPGSFQDIATLLIPELQRRGLFWHNYAVPGGTYRENFYGVKGSRCAPDSHVAASYRWRADS